VMALGLQSSSHLSLLSSLLCTLRCPKGLEGQTQFWPYLTHGKPRRVRAVVRWRCACDSRVGSIDQVGCAGTGGDSVALMMCDNAGIGDDIGAANGEVMTL
jgi:hypothetical protein